jgi:signal transduction histidine kinase/DNA-binding NarL/FixJ family response regulator
LEFSLGRKQIANRSIILFSYILLTGGTLVVSSYFAFLAGWWIPVIAPIIALTGSASTVALYQMLKLQQQRLELTSQKLILEQEKIKAEAASQAKSDFLAKMSHELRTPLNAILGFSQIISHSSELNAEHREYIDIINRSGEHLLELINDILDLSKIEAGMISLEESSFDLYALIDNLEEISKLKAAHKNLQLTVNINSDVPQYITTDKKKLRICLLNLLSNALKFTHSGSVKLQVTLPPELEFKTDDFRLVFEVKDTGLGIAPEEIDQLFKDFVQTKTGKSSTEGTGLGLSITQSFVELLGGKITVNSVVGEGTVFQFDIKLSKTNSWSVNSQNSQKIIALEPAQTVYRILIVDDIQENRVLLVKLLETIGFEVREATNGQEAVALWQNWQPHLIWMDSRMPVMNGLEATREIRAKEKEHSQPPQFKTIIIFLTANSLEDKQGEILAAGCDDLVLKPFSDELIFNKMAQYLGVRYLYADLTKTTGSSRLFNTIDQIPRSFFQKELATMPLSWLNALSEAALSLDEDSVLQLIEQIPENQASLAEVLKDLVINFRLDVILEFTSELINSSIAK